MSEEARRRHGLDAEIEVSPDEARRSVGPRRRLRRLAERHGYRPLLWSGLAVVAMPWTPIPAAPEAMLLANLLYALFAASVLSGAYPFRRPAHRTGSMDDGIIWLGNRSDRSQATCWLSDSDLRKHLLVFGTTGSGKTVFLLGFYYQAIVQGSGCIFVDGKADNSVYWALSALARRAGREDDLLVINYLQPPPEAPDKVTGRPRSPRTTISNTANPFADLSPEQARSQLVAMMRDSGQTGDMWKGRASAMLGNVLAYLCAVRDKQEINLDVQYIRRAVQLPYIVAASRRRDLPEEIVTPLRRYLAELPNYNEAAVKVTVPGDSSADPLITAANVEAAQAAGFEEEAVRQHGFLLMQLTEVMSDMTDTYAHIFRTPLGEVDFNDVVFNRRLLCVMLPALQADPDRLAGLGKLVVAGIRSALGGRALGAKLEGDRRQVIDMKPTNAPVPFFIILDEYGYYSVPGFAVVAAQARSLGCSVLFVGQDYSSFKRGDAKEAASVLANTNTKVLMKLEDPEDTMEVMRKRAGQGYAVQGRDWEKRSGGLRAADSAASALADRISLRDLVAQGPGEAHVIHEDRIERVGLCYFAPERLALEQQESELNVFLAVRDLTTREAEDMVLRKTSVTRLFAEGAQPAGAADSTFTEEQFFALLAAVAEAAPPSDWLLALAGINMLREVSDAREMAEEMRRDSTGAGSRPAAERWLEDERRRSGRSRTFPDWPAEAPGPPEADSPFAAYDGLNDWHQEVFESAAREGRASRTRRALGVGGDPADPDALLLRGLEDADEEEDGDDPRPRGRGGRA